MRINKFLPIIGLAFLGAGLSSCEKDNKITAPSPMAEFTQSAVLGKYFITNTPTSVFKIPVGITNVSDAARTVNFTVTSPTGAAAGTQYTLAGTSIVIPAKTAVDSIALKGLFAGYPGTRKDTLIFKITGGDGVGVFTGSDTYKVLMQKYCDVSLTAIAGNYTKTYENGTYGPYVTQINTVTSVTATTATAKLTNIYDSGITGNITLNWTDPAAFFVTIPSQPTGFTSGGLPLLLRGTPGKTSTFSSCDNTFTLYLDLYTTAGLYDSWTMTMAR